MKGQNKALLVMDVQNAITKMLPDDSTMLDSLASVIASARDNDITVIYAVVAFRKGYPEVSPNNKSFSQIKSSDINFDTAETSQVHPSVAPQPDDIIIKKRRVSAFTGSDLEVLLRSLQVNHLTLTGIATSGVVLSTLREAADKDYRLTVLADCCADRDDEVHTVLTSKIFPKQAKVIHSKEWKNSLKAS